MVILGRQGSGKGTQSLRLAAQYGCVHLSTGDVLRAAPALEELSVQNCGVSNASELTASLEDAAVAPRLRELALGANSIPAESLERLREAAAKRPGLKLTNAEDQSQDTACQGRRE